MEEQKVKCPKCGSDQITPVKKGFSLGKAVGGALLTGGIGVVAGLHGSNRIKLVCLSCGNNFKPGEKPKVNTEQKEPTAQEKRNGCIFGIILIVVAVIVYFLIR